MEASEWRTRYWDDSEVSQLLSLWGDDRVQRELDGTRRDNQVFIKLSEDLRGRGILRSPAQVREKIKILKREYRLCLSRINQTGKLPQPNKFKYFEQMCNILGMPLVHGDSSDVSRITNGIFGPFSSKEAKSLTDSKSDSWQNSPVVVDSNSSSFPNSPDSKPLDLHIDAESGRKLAKLSREGKGGDFLGTELRNSLVNLESSSGPALRLADAKPPRIILGLSSESSDTPYEYEFQNIEGNKIGAKNAKRKRKHEKEIQNVLQNAIRSFQDSNNRFLDLEEKRMKHEKEMELLRRETQLEVIEKISQAFAKASSCACKSMQLLGESSAKDQMT